MNQWKLPWRPLREAPSPEDRALDVPAPEPPPAEAWAASPTLDPPDAMTGVCEALRQPLLLSVDEGPQVPVSLSEQPPGAILELTQRVREARERERSAVPPVYNFGGAESTWSGSGGEW